MYHGFGNLKGKKIKNKKREGTRLGVAKHWPFGSENAIGLRDVV